MLFNHLGPCDALKLCCLECHVHQVHLKMLLHEQLEKEGRRGRGQDKDMHQMIKLLCDSVLSA